MDDNTITALAREYAEEINPVNQLNDYPEAKMIADIMRNALSEVMDEKVKDFDGFLRFLLRRYALVEKSKLEEEYKSSKHYFEHTDSSNSTQKQYFWGRRCAIESIFPELAKEVK